MILKNKHKHTSLYDNHCIEVENLSKYFEIYDRHDKRLRQALINLINERYRFGALKHKLYREHWALKNVSFKISKGEAVAIIGRNGSGKSTLLQILAGTMGPTEGSMTINGRVTALLELGSGFNPSFTGKENVILNAQILGVNRKTAFERFEEIADFADLGDFIDQPVFTYSSGMIMRLGFAVQTVLDPDLLIVDEALAVGDAKFQDKCYRKLRLLRDKGASILFVSHDMNAVTSFCDRSIVLEKGEVLYDGSASEAAKYYIKLLYSKESTVDNNSSYNINKLNKKRENNAVTKQIDQSNIDINRFGNGKIKILSVEIKDIGGNIVQIVESGSKCTISQTIIAQEEISGLSSGFIIRNSKGLELFGITNVTDNSTIPNLSPGDKLKISIDCEMWLAAGEYFIQAANSDESGIQYDCKFDAAQFSVIGTNKLFTNSIVNLKPKFIIEK
jgi:lipopolysaccharide transport system ATP-binding protein